MNLTAILVQAGGLQPVECDLGLSEGLAAAGNGLGDILRMIASANG